LGAGSLCSHHADPNAMKKNWLLVFGQNWPKLRDFHISLGYSHVFQVMEHVRDILKTKQSKNDFFKKIEKINFWSCFANFSHIL
jgi:hypothetical protein